VRSRALTVFVLVLLFVAFFSEQAGQAADHGQDQEGDLLAGHEVPPPPSPRWAARSLRA
jgi:hypothetical protein